MVMLLTQSLFVFSKTSLNLLLVLHVGSWIKQSTKDWSGRDTLQLLGIVIISLKTIVINQERRTWYAHSVISKASGASRCPSFICLSMCKNCRSCALCRDPYTGMSYISIFMMLNIALMRILCILFIRQILQASNREDNWDGGILLIYSAALSRVFPPKEKSLSTR